MDCQECINKDARISELEAQVEEANDQADDFHTRLEEAADNEVTLNIALDEIERVIGRAR